MSGHPALVGVYLAVSCLLGAWAATDAEAHSPLEKAEWFVVGAIVWPMVFGIVLAVIPWYVWSRARGGRRP